VIGVLGLLVVGCMLTFFLITAAVQQAGRAVEESSDTLSASLTFLGFDLAMSVGNYEEAHTYLGNDLAGRYTPDTLQQRWEALGAGDTLSTDYSDPVASGNQVRLVWTISSDDGRQYPINITMEQMGDDWKITGADPELIPEP
jgi:hypothetical protein